MIARSILFFLLLFCASYVQALFIDAEDHRYREGIQYVESKGIIAGYPDGSFRPNRSINRAEFSKMIVAALYSVNDLDSCISSYGIPYTDVPADAWFAPYICVATNKGVFEGYEDGTFRPSKQITFVESAAAIVRGYNFTVEEGNPWFRPYVELLEKKRAIPTTIQAFAANLSRAEMAEMLYRLDSNITTFSSHRYLSLAGRAPVIAADSSKMAFLRPRAPEQVETRRTEWKQQLLLLVNEEREQAGLPPLRYNTLLDTSAQIYADDMFENDYYGGAEHSRIDGSTYEDAIDAVQYTIENLAKCNNCSVSRVIAENIAKGQPTVGIVMENWMNSEGHRANILSSDVDEIGFGIAGIETDDIVWVQHFGSIRIVQY